MAGLNIVNIKVRNYKLDCTKAEFGNPSGINLREFRKIITPTTANIYTDKDIYLTVEAGDRLNEILNKFVGQHLTPEIEISIKDSLNDFLKTCMHDDEIFLEKPDFPYFKIDGDYDYEYY